MRKELNQLKELCIATGSDYKKAKGFFKQEGDNNMTLNNRICWAFMKNDKVKIKNALKVGKIDRNKRD